METYREAVSFGAVCAALLCSVALGWWLRSRADRERWERELAEAPSLDEYDGGCDYFEEFHGTAREKR